MKTEIRMTGLESDFGYDGFGAEANTQAPSVTLQLAQPASSAPLKHFSLFEGIMLMLATAGLCFSPQIIKGVKKQKFVKFGKR